MQFFKFLVSEQLIQLKMVQFSEAMNINVW